MAFTPDTTEFQHIGPEADRAGVTEIAPGRTIQHETLAVLRNAHTLWTNTNRARVLELCCWGEEGASQQPWATEPGAVATLHAVCPVDTASGRDDWTITADIEDGTVTVEAFTSGAVSLGTATCNAVGRSSAVTDTLGGVSTAAYVEISLNDNGGASCKLYALRIYEDETAT